MIYRITINTRDLQFVHTDRKEFPYALRYKKQYIKFWQTEPSVKEVEDLCYIITKAWDVLLTDLNINCTINYE